MKKNSMIIMLAIGLMGLLLPGSVKAQKDMNGDSEKAKAAFIAADAGMSNLFASSYGYVIFPHIGKGALIVGGGHGNGVAYEAGKTVGTAKVTQLTVGAQIGGQAYREVIFFENKEAMDRFKEDKFEFTGGVSATVAASGASANAQYREGVQVFTQAIKGLMVEASVGGQKFKYKGL